ncbi:MAG: ABC transporter ATP-binding protein [Ardenticatenaceae bacterium]|nr:ABC transporter ATP-binding protein [Anaerolineales bacterium]MCB8939781.1 ABC transporter ATP-binding protein [Ardenticatenaceae bacterium]MCB8975135.1 ABC transporter ATP-binding protein [Ardenticatenaceae bacterium]
MTKLELMRRYLRPFRPRLLALFTLLAVSIGLQLYGPQVIRDFLDAAQSGVTTRLLVLLGLLFLGITVVQKGVELYTTYLSEDLGWAATNNLRADLAAHTMKLDMGFHKLQTPGELIERIDGDVSNLAEFFSQLLVRVLGNVVLVVGILALLFREEWRIGLVGLAYALLTLGLLQLISKPTVNVWRAVSKGYAKLHGYVEERIGGTEDIRANGGEPYVFHNLYPLLADVAKSRVRAELIGGYSFSSSYMLYVLAIVVTLALAGTFFLHGQITVGTLFLLVAYVRLMESPIKYIRRQINDLQKAIASIGRINEFLQLKPDVQESVSAKLSERATAVSFQNVSFAYKDRLSVNGNPLSVNTDPTTDYRLPITDNVLHDVTFELEAGKILGLLGRTGSGKTTLTRLLFRLYDVDAGGITLDGIDLRQVSLADVRQHIGLVTQEVQLFAATVRDNLTLFRRYDRTKPPIPDAEIEAALHTLGLGDWLASLPNGLDTELKTGGQGLSAGQAQLLAFTRVFLRNPQLVILDEASSRLDPATEQLLERAIDTLLDGRTAIIIAHRLRTVQRADEILILENGRIQEIGPRLELLNNPNSRFAQLLQTGMEEMLA